RLEDIDRKFRKKKDGSRNRPQSTIDKLEAQLKSQKATVLQTEQQLYQFERDSKTAYSAALLSKVEQAGQSGPVAIANLVKRNRVTLEFLENSVTKNKDQAATWQRRADLASREGNQDLARQSLMRRNQYEQAALDLNEALSFGAEASAVLATLA